MTPPDYLTFVVPRNTLRAPIDLGRLFALLDQRARSGRCQHAAQAVAAGTDTLRQRALGHQLDLDLTRQHLPLGFRVGADMARDDLADQLGVDQLADPNAGAGRVIGNDGQVPLALTHHLVDETGRRPTAMKPPIIRLAPSEIRATASATLIVFLILSPF